jgi:hypothetical protein
VSEENVELHRQANDAFNTRDVEAYIAFCDPEIELHSAVTGPGPAVYNGHEGVRKWHADMTEAFGGELGPGRFTGRAPAAFAVNETPCSS